MYMFMLFCIIYTLILYMYIIYSYYFHIMHMFKRKEDVLSYSIKRMTWGYEKKGLGRPQRLDLY